VSSGIAGFARKRRRVLAAIIAAGAVSAPAALGVETTPSIEAVNVGLYSHSWRPSEVSVAGGHAVTISNPTEVPHGVEWRSAIKPSCEEGAGKVPVGTSPSASGTKWSGQCTFSQPGSYVFYCTVHGPEMTGVVNVTGTPTASTEAPGEVTQTSATLGGTIKPEGQATGYQFEYGTTSAFGQKIPLTPQAAGSDFGADHVAASLTGLKPGTEYHVQLIATYGASATALGGERVFTTPAPTAPAVTTGAATGVGESEATLTGSIDPDGASATEYEFRYGTSTAYGHATPPTAGIPADNLNHAVSAALTGLAPGSGYHYRLVAKNAAGTSEGSDRIFTTKSLPPASEPPPPATVPPSTVPVGQPPASMVALTPPVPLVGQVPPAVLAGSLQLTAARHGPAVHGSIEVSAAGAGGRLEVDLLATGAALATHHTIRVIVGRLIRPAVPAGRVTFAVALGARGKSALRRHRRLALTVRVVLTPTAGGAVVLTRSLVLRG
jgi:plastocyanin